MPKITVDVPSSVVNKLTPRAARCGMDLARYMRGLAIADSRDVLRVYDRAKEYAETQGNLEAIRILLS